MESTPLTQGMRGLGGRLETFLRQREVAGRWQLWEGTWGRRPPTWVMWSDVMQTAFLSVKTHGINVITF